MTDEEAIQAAARFGAIPRQVSSVVSERLGVFYTYEQ